MAAETMVPKKAAAKHQPNAPEHRPRRAALQCTKIARIERWPHAQRRDPCQTELIVQAGAQLPKRFGGGAPSHLHPLLGSKGPTLEKRRARVPSAGAFAIGRAVRAFSRLSGISGGGGRNDE